MICVVGLDVSQKTTAICVVDNAGRKGTLAARAVAIEYRWANGHFRSHPAAESAVSTPATAMHRRHGGA